MKWMKKCSQVRKRHIGGKFRRVCSVIVLVTLAVCLLDVMTADDADANMIQGRINPEDARGGGRWRVRQWTFGGPLSWSSWYDHNHVFNDSISGLRYYEVEFKSIDGCSNKPGNQGFFLNGSVIKTGTYTGCDTTTTTSTTSSSTTTTTTTTATSTTSTSTTSSTSTTTTTVPAPTSCVDISETPLDTQLQAAPANIMFVVDDSGSMDWEIMTDEEDGNVWIGGNKYRYNFDMSDNEYSSSYVLTGDNRRVWRSQWSVYNRMYYDPVTLYDPWPNKSNASTTSPRSNPESSTPTLALSNTYVSVDGINIKNAHYYVWSASESNMYLVNFDGTIKYYQFSSFSTEDDNHDHVLDSEEDDNSNSLIDYTPVDVNGANMTIDASPPDDVIHKNSDGSTSTYAEALQNFANWFSYYRRRELTAKNAMANVITGLQGVQVGLHTIHERVRQPVLKVKVTEGETYYDNTNTLLNLIYSLRSDDGTPLRIALKKMGEYYSGNGASPYDASPYYSAENGGECQQSFTIVLTDGYYNGSSPDVGNQDQGTGSPYQDDYADTLADVAMKYYKNDLSLDSEDGAYSGLLDLVPTSAPDLATHQHMVTYGVSFGVLGTLDPDSYDFYNIDPDQRTPITWPQPVEGEKTSIDDLWHATVNGRGEFLNASDPQDLAVSLQVLMQSIESRIGSGASIAINGEELYSESIMFQASYSSDNWTGNVKAFSLDASDGTIQLDNPLWSAQDNLDSQNWDTGRQIGTYSGTSGIAFRHGDLTADQQSSLSSDEVDYIRGDQSNEVDQGGTYRNRAHILGDIVHSAPLYHDDFIYAGGNDGMLHAFNATSGEEVFAYIPNLVFSKLINLSSPDYSHTNFVDQTSFIKDIKYTTGEVTTEKTLLVGGLGAGGIGYFCLDVTNPSDIDESDLSWVMWEYPKTGTASSEVADLGYGLSRASVVNSEAGWIVLFGNGYNSPDGKAVLFVLDALTGAKLAQIEAGAGPCNGLSTPIPVDIDDDAKVDYVYAGDLKGNLWKFDLTDASYSNWTVAYSNGTTPKPLFQAKDASGNTQPITTSPDVMFHCTRPGYMVVFSTGKYLGTTDLTDTSVQTIYGIWDYGDDADDGEYLGSFERSAATKLSNQASTVTLLEQTEIFYGLDPGGSGQYLRVLSKNIPDWSVVADSDDTNPTQTQESDQSSNPSAHAGWYFDLPISKERGIRDIIIRDGNAIVISSTPNSSPCAAGGNSIIHEMNACAGGQLSDAQFDINGDGIIDDNDKITIDNPEYDPEPPDSPDNPPTIDVPPTGVQSPSMLYLPMILTKKPVEIKYFSSSSGSVKMLTEVVEHRGISYWKIVNK